MDTKISTVNLKSAIESLPDSASEAIVGSIFVSPALLPALGFTVTEVVPQYDTKGGGITDFAARKDLEGDSFLQSKKSPFLLIEVKGRDSNFASKSSPSYISTVNQLKRQLLGDECQSCQWGIITNSSHIQLFRKHGKTIFPATNCIPLTPNNIDKEIEAIRTKIENTNRALTVTVYNNKGGVGKTTTTVNLAAILAFLGKKVLALDFDFNQKDLTTSLGIQTTEGILKKALTDKNINLKSTISTYKFDVKKIQRILTFDIIPADEEIVILSENDLKSLMQLHVLYDKLDSVKNEYDYILIDASPNWRFISRMAVYAADVVLIPTKHNNLFSLENAATAIRQFIPEIQQSKGDGTPVALPIFFNGEKISQAQLEIAQKEINRILTNAKKEGDNLVPYFYPRYTNARKDLHIPIVPSYANIANSAFSRVPAVYLYRSAHDYYKNLAKEYFLL